MTDIIVCVRVCVFCVGDEKRVCVCVWVGMWVGGYVGDEKSVCVFVWNLGMFENERERERVCLGLLYVCACGVFLVGNRVCVSKSRIWFSER